MLAAGAPEILPNKPDGIGPVSLEQPVKVLLNMLAAGVPEIAPNKPDGIGPVRFEQP